MSRGAEQGTVDGQLCASPSSALQPSAPLPAPPAACGSLLAALCVASSPPGASRGPAPGLPPPAASPPRRRRRRPTPDKPTLPQPCRCSRGAVAQHQPAAARALHGGAAPAGGSSGGSGRRPRRDAACGHFGPGPLGLPPQLHCALPQPPGAWRGVVEQLPGRASCASQVGAAACGACLLTGCLPAHAAAAAGGG